MLLSCPCTSGMMTGQLLGGAEPLVAAEYQMAILWLICATAAISTYVGISLAIRHAVFDDCHRMCTERIIKKDRKQEIEVTVYLAMKSMTMTCYRGIHSCFTNRLKRGTALALSEEAEGNTGIADDSVHPTAEGPHKWQGKKEYEMLPSGRSSISTHGAGDGEDIEVGNGHSHGGTLADASKFSIEGDDDEDDDDEENKDKQDHEEQKVDKEKAKHSTIKEALVSHGFSGRVTYRFVNNSPTVTVAGPPLSAMVAFKTKGLNVLSGTVPLFDNKGIEVSLRRGEILTIEGPSGLGKTRLLRAIAQLDRPLSGTLSLTNSASEADLHFDFLTLATTEIAASATASGDSSANAVTTSKRSIWSSLLVFCKDLVGATDISVPLWRRRVIYIPQVSGISQSVR